MPHRPNTPGHCSALTRIAEPEYLKMTTSKKPKATRRIACRLSTHPEPQPARLVSIADAAEQLNISIMSVRRMIADEQLKAVHLRSRVMVLRESIEELLRGDR